MWLVLLLSLLLPMASTMKGCAPGAVLSHDGQKCFFAPPNPAAFHEAEKICAGFGSHLASVHNMYDNGALTVAVKNKPFWLGGYYSNDTWTWTDGTPFDFSRWDYYEKLSNSTDVKCLLACEKEKWIGKDCAFSAHFVCEAEPIEVTTPAPTTPPCPSGAKCLGNYAYTFNSAKLRWKSAKQRCGFRRFGRFGKLASVPNEEVNQLILSLVTGIDYFWIGGDLIERRDSLDDRRVHWTDGSSGNYTNWRNPVKWKAAKKNDHCVYMNTAQYVPDAPGKWGYAPCSKTFPFVCQHPLV